MRTRPLPVSGGIGFWLGLAFAFAQAQHPPRMRPVNLPGQRADGSGLSFPPAAPSHRARRSPSWMPFMPPGPATHRTRPE